MVTPDSSPLKPLSKEEDTEAVRLLTDHLWKTIQRFDVYTGSTNAKAAFLIAFNSALFGGVLLRWKEALAPLAPGTLPMTLAGGALFILSIGCVASCWITFTVVSPFLGSPKSPGLYHSTVFFQHVGEHPTGDAFTAVLNQSDAASRMQDLANQAHAMAVGLTKKFIHLRRAIACILLVELPMILFLAGILLTAHFAAVSKNP
jgi:hypothetical protein